MKKLIQNLKFKILISLPTATFFTLFAFGLIGQAAPFNDNFVNASHPLDGAQSGNVGGSNVGATKESGEPFHYSNYGGKSVWWTWRVPLSGKATVSTLGSDFDTILAVYTGGSVSSLTLIANNDDFNGASQSLVTFSAVAGTEYKIAVDGFGPTQFTPVREGNIQLNISVVPPANDIFFNR
ncbi:MAG: hypothetical protein ACR2H1_09945, partial [Limisphaerales bacterium]